MSVDRREIVAIFVGGFVGAVARAGLAETWVPEAGGWPWATFTVNVAGAFMLGYFVTRPRGRPPRSSYARPLLGTGFCGALTTFSAMQLELLTMIELGRFGLAFFYAAVSVAVGFAGVALGTGMVRRAGLRR